MVVMIYMMVITGVGLKYANTPGNKSEGAIKKQVVQGTQD